MPRDAASSVGQQPDPAAQQTLPPPGQDNSPPATLLRRAPPPRQHRTSLLVRFTVSVPVAVAHFDHSGCVIRYMIRVVDHKHSLTSCVFKRFSEVDRLHEKVGAKLKATKARLPAKLWTTRANRSVEEIEERRVALSHYFSLLLDALFLDPATAAPDIADQPAATEPSRSSPGDRGGPRSRGSHSSAEDAAGGAKPGSMEWCREQTAAFLDLNYVRRPLRREASAEYSTTAAAMPTARSSQPRLRHSSLLRADSAPSGSFGAPPSQTSFGGPPSSFAQATVDGESPRTSEGAASGADGAACSTLPASLQWEEVTLHREETWWSVPGTRVAPSEQQRAASSVFMPLGDTSSYLESPRHSSPAARPRRRTIGFALPLMECRLQIDGTWVLIVRHDRGAPKALVRRRHAEAVHLLRYIDNTAHLPSVAELREILNQFKRGHHEQLFSDAAMRQHVHSVLSSALRRSTFRPDEDDRDANSRLSRTNLSRLRPGDDDVDELDVTAVSSVTDVRPAQRDVGGLDSSHSDQFCSQRSGTLERDDMVTLVDMHDAVTPPSGPRRSRGRRERLNTAHYSYDAVAVVPWRSRTAPSQPGSGKRVTTLDVGLQDDASLEPTNSFDVRAEGLSDDTATAEANRGSFASASSLVDEASFTSPLTKVKVRAKNATLKDCRCDANHFCRQPRGCGDVYATIGGHCIVVHPAQASPSPGDGAAGTS